MKCGDVYFDLNKVSAFKRNNKQFTILIDGTWVTMTPKDEYEGDYVRGALDDWNVCVNNQFDAIFVEEC